MRISDWSSDVCSSDLVAGQDHVELVLLFSGRSGSANSGRSSSNGSSGRNAPLFFEQLRKLRSFQNGQRRQVVNDLCKISHFHSPSNFNRRPREGGDRWDWTHTGPHLRGGDVPMLLLCRFLGAVSAKDPRQLTSRGRR